MNSKKSEEFTLKIFVSEKKRLVKIKLPTISAQVHMVQDFGYTFIKDPYFPGLWFKLTNLLVVFNSAFRDYFRKETILIVLLWSF